MWGSQAGDGERSDADGHGTHVAASVAGQPSCSSCAQLPEFSGAAPGAKIAFFDIGASGTPAAAAAAEGRAFRRAGRADGSLATPPSLAASMFPWPYAMGARVHVNAWGVSGEAAAYTADDLAFDSFSHSHPDMLFVVALGNGGARGRGSVLSPALAKNVLSVGATISFPAVRALASAGRRAVAADALSPLSPQMFSEVFGPDGLAPDPSRMPPDAAKYTPDDVAGFSSIGPAPDGRVKPELVAPGMWVLSARNGQTAESCAAPLLGDQGVVSLRYGTSHAAPGARAGATRPL